MRANILFAFLLCAFAIAPAPHAQAADFQVVNRDTADKREVCGIRLSGTIVAGDLDALKRAAAGVVSQGSAAFTLCLNSPGGDYREGLRIADHLMETEIVTLLEPGAECYSACAIIFMAGGFGWEGQFVVYRTMHKTARLGFHAPYMKDVPAGNYAALTIEQTYAAAVAGLRDLANLGKRYRAMTPVIPTPVLQELLLKGPSELFLIDTVYKAMASSINVAGITPPKVTVQMLGNACVNQFADADSRDLSAPPPAWQGNDVTRRRNEFWFGGFAIAPMQIQYCVARYPLNSPTLPGHEYDVYLFLVSDRKLPLDEEQFRRWSSLRLYPPPMLLRDIP